MAAPDPNKILKGGGTIWLSPNLPLGGYAPDVDPLEDFKTGATQLGSFEKGRHVRVVDNEAVLAPDEGGIPVEFLRGKPVNILLFMLRTWDNDVVNTIFPRTTLDDTTQTRSVQEHRDSVRSGSLMSDDEVSVLYVPGDPLTEPSIWIRRAIPFVTESEDAQERMVQLLGLRQFRSTPVAFYAMPTSEGPPCQVGLLETFTASDPA